MGILNWFFEPISEIKTEVTDDIADKISSILSPAFTSSFSVPVNNEVIKEKSVHSPYRPKTLDEYIGQNRIKDFLLTYIKGLKKDNQARLSRKLPARMLPHLLISGLAGTGKTTLAEIVGNLLDEPVTNIITSSLRVPMDIVNLINKKPKILFLDEIHSLASNRNLCETFYTIMEDFKWKRYTFEPFTLIGATTEKGEMIQKIKPFVDRFKIHTDLDDYSKIDIITIGKKYNEKMFPNYLLSKNILQQIADNARQTPRLMIRLVEGTVYFESDVNNVLRGFDIIDKGFYKRDLEALKYIEKNEKGVGLQAIATYLKTTEKDYLYNVEPFLLCNDLLSRKSRGRTITDKGKEIIKELQKKEKNI